MIQKPQKIVVFRALKEGDMLCAVPALRALRTAYPNSKITLIGLENARDFTKRFSKYIDSFIPFPGDPMLPEQKINIRAVPQFFQRVQNQKFDLAIQMHGDGSVTNSLVCSFGAAKVFGSLKKGKRVLDTNAFVVYDNSTSEIERCLVVAEKAGGKRSGEYLEFPISDEERREVYKLEEYFKLRYRPYICLHPGASAAQKRWPVESFAKLGDSLSDLGYTIVITGSEDERWLAEDIARKMQERPIILSGKLSLGGTASVIKSSQLTVSNCTVVSHIADALNALSVVVFVSSDPKRWAPLNEHTHRPVYPQLANDKYVFRVCSDQLKKLNEQKLFRIVNSSGGISL